MTWPLTSDRQTRSHRLVVAWVCEGGLERRPSVVWVLLSPGSSVLCNYFKTTVVLICRSSFTDGSAATPMCVREGFSWVCVCVCVSQCRYIRWKSVTWTLSGSWQISEKQPVVSSWSDLSVTFLSLCVCVTNLVHAQKHQTFTMFNLSTFQAFQGPSADFSRTFQPLGNSFSHSFGSFI